jgi:CDP-diacylglycerol--glycerol-3-phosphate 3-phosphatidyltransferase
MGSLLQVPQPESMPGVRGYSFDAILHLHRFAAEVLRKSIAPLRSTFEFLLTPEYLSPRFSRQIGVVWCASPASRRALTHPYTKSIVKRRWTKPPGRRPRRQAPMNLPNSLTLLRIFFVPVLIVILLTRSPNVELWGYTMHFEVWGVLILLMAAATDWADGYFARRRLQVTTLGILLDPIADKLLISAAFISLVDMHLVKAWMVVIIIGREFTVLGLRNIASAEGFTIEASTLGKTKMVLQVCAVAVLIAGAGNRAGLPWLYWLAQVLLWLVVISALVSAAQYFRRFWSHVDDSIKQRRRLRMLEARKKSQDAVPL